MKKLSSILILLLIIPINVFACPHVDRNGGAHIQTYNNDYTEANMIYPKENYLYVKDVTMEIDEKMFTNIDEDNILKETYSFPVLLDLGTYVMYYWFLDESLVTGNYKEGDIETTIANLDKINVDNINYNLSINLSNTYTNGLEYETNKTQEIYYDVNIDSKYEDKKYINLIEESGIELVSNDILNVDAKYKIVNNDNNVYETVHEEIKDLYDKINMTLITDSEEEDIIAINLDEKLINENFIEVVKTEGGYSFDIDKDGTYILAKNSEIKEVEIEETVEIEEDTHVIKKQDENVNNMLIYCVTGAVVIILICFIAIKIFKKNRQK